MVDKPADHRPSFADVMHLQRRPGASGRSFSSASRRAMTRAAELVRGRDRAGGADGRLRAAPPAQSPSAPRVVLRSDPGWRHPDRHRLAPDRSIPSPPLDDAEIVASAVATTPIRIGPSSMTSARSAAQRARPRLHPRRLVHARRPAHLGRRPLHDPGTEGYIELRKYVDIAGRDGTDHLFLVDPRGDALPRLQ